MKLLFCLLGTAITNFALAQPNLKDYTLLFDENFEGDTLNTSVWRYRIDRRSGMGYMDGLNRAENVRVKDGKLIIDCRQELIDGKMENTGGGIISLKNFGYGYYECLSRPFMNGRGVHTAFWQRGSSTPNNEIFEIDSYEIDSKQWLATNNLYLQLGDKERKYVPWPHRAQIPFQLDANGWFLDAYEYTPNGIVFYDNGKEVARTEPIELNAAQAVWLTALNGVGEVDSDKQPGCTEFEYFRFYAKDYPGINILSNGNFEFNQDKVDPHKPIAWTTIGTESAFVLKNNGAYRDKYCLHIGSEHPFQATLRQCMSYIKDGEYVLSAMVKSSGNFHDARLCASYTANVENNYFASVSIPKANTWTRISMPVTVRNNEVYISLQASGEGGEWVEVDDINFMKPLAEGQKAKAASPFDLYGQSIWQIGFQKPIDFPGDERFYFFDRMAGLGDSISVCFTVNAFEKANMIPIARIPQKGNSGWAVQLTDDGGLIFRIGSIANHTDVKVNKVYHPRKPVAVTCCFENGTASIFVNGKKVKSKMGITQDTNDKTAAGRLGTVGQMYQAVGEVVLQTSNKEKESGVIKNFRGQLSKVAIYNKHVVR